MYLIKTYRSSVTDPFPLSSRKANEPPIFKHFSKRKTETDLTPNRFFLIKSFISKYYLRYRKVFAYQQGVLRNVLPSILYLREKALRILLPSFSS